MPNTNNNYVAQKAREKKQKEAFEKKVLVSRLKPRQQDALRAMYEELLALAAEARRNRRNR